MRNVFSGLMARLVTRSIPDLQPSFDEFAAALKKRAERGKWQFQAHFRSTSGTGGVS